MIPLHEIFNDSLSFGVFPTKWKRAFVTPIHKSGSSFDVTNYRPISKLSIPAKVLDKIVSEELHEIFKDVIIPEQHGFMKKRSTTTNLLRHTESIHKCLDKAGQLDVIYTDFSKAFDKVDHKILITKLERMGISGTMLKWFESYITGRSQQVQIDGSLSNIINVTSSVAQGSNLGPLLFALFINDIHEVLEDVDFVLYADDLKMSKSITDSTRDCAVLQRTVDRLVGYCRRNNLSLNVKKCTVVNFTRRSSNFINYDYNIDGTILERTLTYRDLGVIYDSRLTFNTQLDEVSKKCNRMMGFILRIGKDFRNVSSFLSLFHSLIRSQLEYAVLIWNPHCVSHKDRLERIQRKFLRHLHRKKLIPGAGEDFNYDESCKILKIDKLETRRAIAETKFILNSLSGRIDSHSFLNLVNINVPQRSTRSCQPFRTSSSRTEIGRFSPMNRMMENINTISEHCTANNIGWDIFEEAIHINVVKAALS